MNARQRAGDAVAAMSRTIDSRIAAGTWPPGSKLPTERELASQFGIARTTARKCLEEFERAGRIVRKVGQGTFVANRTGAALSALAECGADVSPAELMEVRLLLEPAAMGQVVARASAADLDGIAECLQRSEAARSPGDFERWDGMLHKRIIDAAHNRLLSDLYQAIDAIRHQAEWGKLKERTSRPERRRSYEAQHRALVAALRDRDGDRAAAIARAHLLKVRTILLGA